jgi:hypothetical protein
MGRRRLPEELGQVVGSLPDTNQPVAGSNDHLALHHRVAKKSLAGQRIGEWATRGRANDVAVEFRPTSPIDNGDRCSTSAGDRAARPVCGSILRTGSCLGRGADLGRRRLPGRNDPRPTARSRPAARRSQDGRRPPRRRPSPVGEDPERALPSELAEAADGLRFPRPGRPWPRPSLNLTSDRA